MCSQCNYLWPKADDFFGHYSAAGGLMVADILASGRKSTTHVAELSNYVPPYSNTH